MGSLWARESGEWVPVSSLDNKETYIITHGLNNHLQDKAWIAEMADALIAKGKQVLAVSWDSSNDYSASGIALASGQTALLLAQLCSYSNISLSSFVSEKLNLIGHSFGAHYSAYLASKLPGDPRSLVGLDSAAELPQSHEIILGPGAAQTVYFYKSSPALGGGGLGRNATWGLQFLYHLY